MAKINIGLETEVIAAVTKILNEILANEYVLYTKTRNYHWNVTGTHFNDYHKFFEEQYGELDESIDDIAERVRMLGSTPVATLTGFLKLSSIKEADKALKSEDMVKQLSKDHETLIRHIRNAVEKISDLGDNGNEDFLIALMQQHEKMAWMLRSMIE